MKGYKCDGCGEFITPDKIYQLELTVNSREKVYADIYTFDLCDSCYMDYLAELPYNYRKDK